MQRGPAARRSFRTILASLLALALTATSARAQRGGSESNVGYIDSAIPRTQYRLRYDTATDVNRFDRGEFLFATWREDAFHNHGIVGEAGRFKSNSDRGLDPLPTRLNFQEVSNYFEIAVRNRFSVFVDLPIRKVDIRDRFIDKSENFALFFEPADHEAPEILFTDADGFGDLVTGFKWAFLADERRYLTAQLRVFVPTGDARQGLGTGHSSVEPGLLSYARLGQRMAVEGQFKAWIPINGNKSDIDGRSFASDILIYGVGFSYDVVQRPNFRITPVVEVIGWSVLNGLETAFDPASSRLFGARTDVPFDHGVIAAETTIVNGKIGVRVDVGEHNDFYVGWGHALTGDRWYRDILRLEYRLKF